MPDTTITAERPQTEQAPQPEPKPQLPAAVALRGGASIKPIIPQDFDQAYRLARIIAASGSAPKSYMMKDPSDLKEYLSVERIAVAIMHGLEVGLPPMQAVQGIAVINGMPTVYGDARDALVEASGLLEDRLEEHELDEQGLFLWWRCTVWRKGRKTPIVQTVTRPQAARAGWLKKQGPWQESPNRMAQQRARGWAYRDAFPDVLKGLVDRDEALDTMVDVTTQGSATTAPAEPRRSDFRAAPAQAQDVETEPDHVEEEGWPLHDETGETVGRYGTGEWIGRFLDAVDKLDGKEREALLDNNRDTAKAIWEDDSTPEETAKTLSAPYEPAKGDATADATVKNWRVEAVGEAAKIKGIKELISDIAGVPAEVDQVLADNTEFIGKLSAFKRDDINKAAAGRKLALANLPA